MTFRYLPSNAKNITERAWKMAPVSPKRNPFVPKVRLANSYKAVTRSAISANTYPCGVRSLLPAIHDVQYYQNILRNASNFVDRSSCDVFEIKNGSGNWITDLDEDGLGGYLKVCLWRGGESQHLLIRCRILLNAMKRPRCASCKFDFVRELNGFLKTSML
jgi:hypothetical protein